MHHFRIPAWQHEQSCVQLLFPQFVVTPSSGNSAYFTDYSLQSCANPAIQLSVECKADMKAMRTGRIFIESVDASLRADGSLREVHVSNVLSFLYDVLVILCPSAASPPATVLALAYYKEQVPHLVSLSTKEWQGTPSSHPHTHTRGWLIPISSAKLAAWRWKELQI